MGKISKYETYAKVRQAIRGLQEKQKELEAEISEELGALDGTLKTKYGTLYTIKRTNWIFPAEVKKQVVALKNQIVETQEKAKEAGLATGEPKLSIGWREK